MALKQVEEYLSGVLQRTYTITIPDAQDRVEKAVIRLATGRPRLREIKAQMTTIITSPGALTLLTAAAAIKDIATAVRDINQALLDIELAMAWQADDNQE